jgi:ATP-dependent Lhr-like helicase
VGRDQQRQGHARRRPDRLGQDAVAFLWSLDRLASTPPPEDPKHRCRVLYVSPLKALAVDVERNLRAPLIGIRQASQRLELPVPDITVGTRSGDTPPEERRRFAKTPPDVFITTPESLFLVLTSAARESLRGVETVIVDEVHAVSGTKRGAHLALTLERLDALLERPAQRVGLSATVRPIDEVARFLGGSREVTWCSRRAPRPSRSRSSSRSRTWGASASRAGRSRRLGRRRRAPLEHLARARGAHRRPRRAHRSTIVFANSRRLAERLTSRLNEIATERAHGVPEQEPIDLDRPEGSSGIKPAACRSRGGPPSTRARAGVGKGSSMPWATACPPTPRAPSRSLAPTTAASPASSGRRSRTPSRPAGCLRRRHQQPRARHRHGRRRPGGAGRVAAVGASGLQRVGRAGHQVGAISRGVVLPKYRGDLVQCAVVAERMVTGGIEATTYPRNPLDVLAQQVVAMCAMEPWTVDDLTALVRRSAPFSTLPTSALEATLDMLSGRYPSDEFAELRPRITWDRVTGVLAGRPGAQRLAVTSGGTIPDRGMFGVFLVGDKGSRVGELDEEMVYESRVGDVFLLGSSAWRIEDITHDRVLVTPAPGPAGRMPYWHGDAPAGRSSSAARSARSCASCRRCPTTTRAPGSPPPASTRARPSTCSPTSPSSARPPACCPTTAPSWSSGSATSSATGGSRSTRRSGRR